jgi:hypothetical protein
MREDTFEEKMAKLTKYDHLAEIARLADEIRTHMDALPGVFNVRVNPAWWTNPTEVQFDRVAELVVAISPLSLTEITSTEFTNDGKRVHCSTTVRGIRLIACEKVEVTV